MKPTWRKGFKTLGRGLIWLLENYHYEWCNLNLLFFEAEFKEQQGRS
jgi:hypothetical protein